MTTIYVALLNEGVDVWRPVHAVPLDGDLYRIEDSVPVEEDWEFPPGSVVRCERREPDDDSRLFAVTCA
jgi:hypothetical protein